MPAAIPHACVHPGSLISLYCLLVTAADGGLISSLAVSYNVGWAVTQIYVMPTYRSGTVQYTSSSPCLAAHLPYLHTKCVYNIAADSSKASNMSLHCLLPPSH